MASSQLAAKVSLDLQDDVSKGANAAASSLESLRGIVNGSQDSLKSYQSALRNLRGSTEEVKSAKEQLKAKIGATRDAISSATLAIHKQGTSLEALNKRHQDFEKSAAETLKKETEKKKAMGESKDLLESLRERYQSAGGAAGVFAAGSLAVAGAIVAVGVAAVSGLVSLTKWIVAGADAARTMSLMREGALGSAKDAGALGSQIDALAAKVPLARDKLSDIGLTLHRAGIGGQTLVDSMRAIAGASAGLDDSAGAQLKALVERGKLTQRFQVGRLELQGSGIDFKGLSEKLAKNLGVSVQSAQKALAEGRVKLSDGAKAMADAVDERFGATNKKKLLGLDVQSLRLRENLAKLTDGVNIEPLLGGVSKLVALFSDSTVSGSALKTIITLVGNTISNGLTKVLPYAEQGFKKLIIAGLDVAIMALKAKKSFEAWFSQSNIAKVNLLGAGLELAKTHADNFLKTAEVIGTVVGASVQGAVLQIDALIGAYRKLSEISKGLFSMGKGADWSSMGRDIVGGLVKGLTDGIQLIKDATKRLAFAARDTFKEVLGIRSPSREFAKFGDNISQGVKLGVTRSTPEAQGAVEAMVTVPPRATSGGRAAPRGNVTISIPITITATDAESVRRAVKDEGLLNQVTAMLERAALTAAVRVA